MFSKTSRNRALVGGAALAATVAIALSSPLASTTVPSELNGLTLGKTTAEITANLTERSYQVREIEREDGMLEVEAVKDGKEYEIYVDPVTGLVVKSELED